MELSGKTLIITGAARGIGAALARRFDREKPEAMVLLDIDPPGLEQLAGQLACGDIVIDRCDVADPASIGAAVRDLERRRGRVDLFCANAGIFPRGGADAPLDIWQRAIDINLMSHVHAARACLPGMLARGAGYFLHTISAAGLLSQIGSAPYTATKHGALGFAEWLAITHGDAGIGVTALCPQGVDTAMLADIGNPATVAVDGLVSAEAVADCALDAIRAGKFLALPHPDVADYFRRKAEDHDRWLRGMRRLQKNLAP